LSYDVLLIKPPVSKYICGGDVQKVCTLTTALQNPNRFSLNSMTLQTKSCPAHEDAFWRTVVHKRRKVGTKIGLSHNQHVDQSLRCVFQRFFC